ncbi:MAG: hypothetical protein ACYDH4_11340 [Candidatus Cryosericum sp.]
MEFRLVHPLQYEPAVGERCNFQSIGAGLVPCKVLGIREDRDLPGRLVYRLKVTGRRSRIYPHGYIVETGATSIRRPKKTRPRGDR